MTKDKMKPFKKSLQGKSNCKMCKQLQEDFGTNCSHHIRIDALKEGYNIAKNEQKEAVEGLMKDIDDIDSSWSLDINEIDDLKRLVKKHFAGVLEK